MSSSSRSQTAARVAASALLSTLAAIPAHADDTDAALRSQIDAQEQRIRILERKLELADETSAANAASTPAIKLSNTGFALSSADGKNSIRLRSTFNADYRYFNTFDPTANLANNVAGTSAYNSADGFLIRKARPYVEGTVNGIYDWRLQPEFGGGRSVILDAYVAARFQPWAVITVGKFKNPVGLERLQTEQYNKFVELGFPSSLVPNRDLGIQYSGSVLNGGLSYAVGVFNGVTDGNGSDSNPTPDADSDGRHEFAVRVFALPFANSNNFYLRGLGVGIAGTSGSKHGNADISLRGSSFSGTTQIVPFINTNTGLPGYRTAAQQTLFSYRGDNADTLTANEATYADGTHTRIAPQAYYYYGSLGVIAEYAKSTQEVSRHVNATTTRADKLTTTAWQVAASYFLTGEDAAYNSATPRNNFNVGKPGIGAWEIAARLQKINIDNAAFTGGSASFANPLTAASGATGYSVALNWYLNANVRFTAEYDLTRFDGGASSSGVVRDREDEKTYVSRVAIAF